MRSPARGCSADGGDLLGDLQTVACDGGGSRPPTSCPLASTRQSSAVSGPKASDNSTPASGLFWRQAAGPAQCCPTSGCVKIRYLRPGGSPVTGCLPGPIRSRSCSSVDLVAGPDVTLSRLASPDPIHRPCGVPVESTGAVYDGLDDRVSVVVSFANVRPSPGGRERRF